jgi:hypothetical protein
MKAISPRPIKADEVAVLEAALLGAPPGSISPDWVADLRSLIVVGICECGCRSLYFSPTGAKDRPIATSVGRTPSGKFVEVMIWVAADRVSALDIVDYESSGELPAVDTIR